MLQTIRPAWSDLAIVAASGPSLTKAQTELCRAFHSIAVNDAYRLMPFASALYAGDGAWWQVHEGAPGFAGEKWSSHGDASHNDKRAVAALYGLNLVRGVDAVGFSLDPSLIHYGENSGYQAINLAVHKLGARGTILLIGFDMRMVDGRRHFFGEHPAPLRQTVHGYRIWPKHFARAAAALPPELKIINCTPQSALTCFPMMDLADALTVAA